MSVPKIINLEELLSKYIDGNKKIVDTKITRLTAPGDNFGSEMLKVDLVLNNTKTDKKEDLSVVAKLIPEFEFYQKIFNVQWTFKNERKFYDTIVPILQQFQREQGVQDVIEFFPKFYGARYNMDDIDGKIDENAVLVMENLKVKGYGTENRRTGFDLPTTKLLLGEIAKFHAVPLALRMLRPQIFETNVKPYMAAFQPESAKPSSEEMESFLIDVVKNSEKYGRFASQVEKSLTFFGGTAKTFREPYSTLVHQDLWVNNIMIRQENGKTVDCKIVDFQTFSYDSPATDLFFFLFTSVRKELLADYLDHFIEYYHQVFVDTLRSLQCDTSLFSHKLFLEEMANSAKVCLGKTLFMSTFIIIGLEGGLKRPDPTKAPNMEGARISDANREKLFMIIHECEKRGWLTF